MAAPNPKISAPWPRQAQIFEVGPRDGLQNETKILDVATRVHLIRLLIDSGLENIEVGSFVKPDRIPQLVDTKLVLKALRDLPRQDLRTAKFWAFVPNDNGLEQAAEAEVDGVTFFVAISDTFNRKNVNQGRDETLANLPDLVKKARRLGLKTRIYLSTLVYCPYEGAIAAGRVEEMVNELMDCGPHDIALSDTTGDANPKALRKIFEKVFRRHPVKSFALHLHDTRGLALANVLEGLYHGITKFDSSVAGMGGCPFAPGASGNLATEDLVNMLAGMNLANSVDLGRLSKAGFLVESLFGRKMPSNVLRTLEKVTHESRAG